MREPGLFLLDNILFPNSTFRDLPEDFQPPPSFFRKRKSITADRFEPGEEEENYVVHPKTDEQLQRLRGTIKKVR